MLCPKSAPCLIEVKKDVLSLLGGRAVRVGDVGDQVGKRVRLDDGDDADIGVRRDGAADCVDVSLVVVDTVVGDSEFSVGSLFSMVRACLKFMSKVSPSRGNLGWGDRRRRFGTSCCLS